MFFSRKKDKDVDPPPVVAKKPPVAPRRGLLPFQRKDESPPAEPPPARPPVPSRPLGTTATSNGHHVTAFSVGDDLAPFVYSTLEPAPPTNGHSESSSVGQVFGALKEFDVPLSLPALSVVQVRERRLTLHRNVSGEFAFSVRRVQLAAGQPAVVLAEPTDGPGIGSESRAPRPEELRTGLLPGDELLAVNGVPVAEMSREHLQAMLRESGHVVELTVRAVPELAEYCDRRGRRGARDEGDSLLLAHIQPGQQENVAEEERYWLVHKGGYTVARLLESLPDGRFRVAVAGREMIVDSTDADKANPTSLDRVEDLAVLRYLNETSTVHLLRQRFGSSLHYTNAGSQSVLCVSESTEEENPLVLHKRLVSLFRGCRRSQMPPHIYATAQHVYRTLQQTGASQAVLLTGLSGSGKSSQLRSFVHYLTVVAGWTNTLPFEKLSSALGILEAFGHAATSLNKDATRLALLFGLGFDRAAALRAAKLEPLLLEADRVLRRPQGESNFHVFYYLWEGVQGELRAKLTLDEIDRTAVLTRLQKAEDREQAAEAWRRLLEAFLSLGFTDQQVKGVCLLLGAIIHLATAEATPGPAPKSTFVRAKNAQQAAALLGTTPEALADAVFRGKSQGGQTSGLVPSTSSSSIGRFSMSNRTQEGPDALVSFVAALYQELFSAIVAQINKNLSGSSAASWITILDLPGLNVSTEWVEGPRKRSGLSDLVFNYLNERVSELFHDVSFTEPVELYAREQVEVDTEKPIGGPHALNRLLDQKQQLLNSVDIDQRADERRGLLVMLEEESLFPGATDDSFLERVFVHFEDSRLVRRGAAPRTIQLAHGLDCCPQIYSVEGWVRQAQPSPSATAAAPALLQNTNNSSLSSLFSTPALAAASENARLRRATQSVQALAVARRATGGFFASISSQVDHAISTLRRASRVHFVHCVQASPPGMNSSSSLDVPFVRTQLRSLLLIDAVRANNRGYPERLPFRDFRRRFECLIEGEEDAPKRLSEALDDRAAAAKILERMDVYAHRYRLGISQVLLRADVLAELEERRDLSLSGLIADFQRVCRRHLAQKWLLKRRTLETAIRCIQKNGKVFLRVKEWPWWKLYTRVLPLLAVNKSDSEHREWEMKVQRLEGILNEMRLSKTRLEGRVSELEELLSRSAQATQDLELALERESEERVTLEQRVQHLRAANADDDRVSRVSSTSRMPDDEKTAELRKELERVREAEGELRVKTQKTVQKLQDLETELEDTRSRNAVLEKKQTQHNEEVRLVHSQLEEVREAKTKAERERDESLTTAQRRNNELQSLKTENAELRTQAAKLRRELEEREESKGGDAELQVLRKTNRDLEAKCTEQEDELDELAGRAQQLEQTVTRLELAAERHKSEAARDLDVREVEINELKAQYQRRLRAFEDQIADLTDNNASLVKQNRALEARVRQNDLNAQNFELSGGHYKRELKRALALLADTQSCLAHERETAPSAALVRQLKEQLEDAEAAKLAAQKSRHSLESEVGELRAQLEQALAGKTAAEERCLTLLREKNATVALLDERDEEYNALMKKYKAQVQKSQIDSIDICDKIEQIAELENAKAKLYEEVQELKTQAEYAQHHQVEKHRLLLAEQKIRDTEAKLDLEVLQRERLESMLAKTSDELELTRQAAEEATTAREKEAEIAKRLRKEVAAAQDLAAEARKRETDIAHKHKLAKSDLEKLEDASKATASELKHALKRIETLQLALQDGLDSDEEDGEDGGEVGDEDERRVG